MKSLFHQVWIALCLSLFATLSLPVKAESYSYNGTSPKVVIDVRTAEEFAGGHVPGGINIPHDQIATGIGSIKGLRKDEPILLYCRSGHRAGIAKQSLDELGFKNVLNGGGIDTLTTKLKICKEPSC